MSEDRLYFSQTNPKIQDFKNYKSLVFININNTTKLANTA